MYILSPETDKCPSWISGRERMAGENISWSIFTKEYCWPGGCRARNLLITLDAHQTQSPRPATIHNKRQLITGLGPGPGPLLFALLILLIFFSYSLISLRYTPKETLATHSAPSVGWSICAVIILRLDGTSEPSLQRQHLFPKTLPLCIKYNILA